MLDSSIYDCQKKWKADRLFASHGEHPMQEVVVPKHPCQEPSPSWQEPSVETAPHSVIPSETLPKVQAGSKFREIGKAQRFFFLASNGMHNPCQ
jgi:hypothetical protein